MTAYVSHQVANVRRYAARAAGLMKDQASLRRLAVDPDDNVCTAAISELLSLGADDLEPIFLSALGRADYQLLLLVSDALKGVKPDKDIANALADALRRVTADRKETSREVRLALISRMETHATTMQARVLEPLARDFDPPVAEAAGRVSERLTSRTLKIEPQLVPRPLPPTAGELLENVIARVTLDSGRVFYLRFFSRATPLTYTRFVRLVRNRYYDGLSFHRVIPNRLVQGGSPGGNDEVGDGPFMRDELTTMRHERGTAGLMTRRRDQGAGQFFVNLVDNPAFDLEYTVFARVCDDGMDVVDRILEGTKMTRIELLPATRTCRSDR
jgi:peptidyl-prolyl cis-trans isomerase B (cyclophilin B)